VSARRARRPTAGRLRRAVVLLGVVLAGVVAVSEADRWAAVGDRPAERGQRVDPVAQSLVPLVRLAPTPPVVEGEGGFAFTESQPYDTTRPVAFDPCRPVRWTVRRGGEVPGGDALLQEAVAEVARATGLLFERVADTDEAPQQDRPTVQHDRYGPGAAPVLVVWSDEREWPLLSGLVAGLAGSQWLDVGRADSRRYVTGQLVLDGEQLHEALGERGGTARVRAVLMHELAHVVGLGHVDDAGSLMHPHNAEQTAFRPGDLRGLRAVGSGECFDDWELVVGTP
jgi:hypothetical protein